MPAAGRSANVTARLYNLARTVILLIPVNKYRYVFSSVLPVMGTVSSFAVTTGAA
ncbi:hypothetical protein Barb7_01366 [Bacteroidales bacterium Barb7]|nr:hypothetical protein Barb7_01366 [Bacteroidales bacterium Barb7]